MRRYLLPLLAAAAFTVTCAAHAQDLSVSARCKDGTTFTGTSRAGACVGHHGVKKWDKTAKSATHKLTAATTPPATTTTATKPTATTTTANTRPTTPQTSAKTSPTPPAPQTKTASTQSAPPPASGASAAAAPSQPPSVHTPPPSAPGVRQVWVSRGSKVYHCPGDHLYGKTKAGAYMPESQAKAQGLRPDHNKACST